MVYFYVQNTFSGTIFAVTFYIFVRKIYLVQFLLLNLLIS